MGGRSATLDTPTARVVAIDPRTRRVVRAGSLDAPAYDLTAIALGDRILVAGGRGGTGTLASLDVLEAVTRTLRPAAAHAPRHVDVYAHDGANDLSPVARLARPLVYVPNSRSDTVDVVDPRTRRIVEHFAVGTLPQHVVPSWDLRTLYVTNDVGNSLTPIDPRTGLPGRPSPSPTRTTWTSRPTAATRSSSPSGCTASTSGTRTELNGDRMKTVGFIRTGRGTHGLYPSRNGRLLYVTNRTAGTISVLSYREGRRHRVDPRRR